MTVAGSQWVCMDCGARGGSPGNCAKCGEGPLLDLADPQVRSAMALQDSEGERRRMAVLLGVASGIAAVIGLPLVLFLGMFIGVAAVVGLGLGVFVVLRFVFPYRRRFAGV